MTNTHESIVEQPNERGSALILVLLVLMMMSALTAALTVNGQTETLISRNQRSGAQAQAAAEAGLNHAVELATTYIFEWNANGWTIGPEEAVDALLLGPDGASGTTGTDADNGSLAARVGAGIETAEAIPLNTPQSMVAGGAATYEALILDDEADAPDEDGNLVNDINETLIVRATGYGPDDTMVVLEALIAPAPLGAIVTNGDLEISGSVTVDGTNSDIHSNGDLDISGGGSDIEGTVTASGTYTGSPAGSGGAAPIPLPTISASDYLHYADFILTSSGTMTNQAGTVLCTWSGGTPCNNWDFDSGIGEWSFGSSAPATGSYYVEGSVKISGSPGSAATPMQITIIAEDSIDMSGSPDIIPGTPELLFVTDGDLEITGGLDIIDPLTTQGQILVHEQVNLAGNPTIGGQLRACKEITACTVDRRVVRCARGGGHPAGKACSAGARAHGAIAPGVGGD